MSTRQGYISVIVLGLLLVFTSMSFASMYYISPSGYNTANGATESTPWKTFAKAFSVMSAGDELILLDGTYSDAAGTGYISWDDGSTPNSAQPPSGTSLTNMTVIRAKNEGSVMVVGGNGSERQPLFIGRSARKDSYIKIQGITFEGGGHLWNTSYITIKNCGFHSEKLSAGAVFSIGVSESTHSQGNSYNLIEDCWIWGKERIIASNYNANNNVWRRVVIRGDGCSTMSSSGNPNVGITVYDSSNCSLQNIIVIDRILDGGSPFGSFATAQHTEGMHYLGPNEWLGCIPLKSEDGGFVFGADNANDNTHTLRNCIAWDCGQDNINIPLQATNILLENITTGKSGAGTDNLRVAPMLPTGIVRNIIAYQAGRYGVNSAIQPTYCNVYNAASSAYNQTTCTTGAKTTNPLNDGTTPSLKYLVRIEDGSALKGAGAGGADYGANVVKRYGVDGSRYREAGYNTLTTKTIWPWPNEDRIKADMSASSTRGFCANGTGLYGGPITLTSYIWEYLGNPIPPEIYGGDTVAPATITNLAATTGINPGEINLSWTAPGDDGNTGTAAAYTIKYASSAITTEADFNAATDVTAEPLPLAAGTNQSMTVTGLTAGQLYYFAMKTQDEVPNISGLSNSPSAVSQYGNAAPVLAAIGNKTVVEGVSLSFAVSATDPDGDLLTYSASNLPLGATFNVATKSFSWTPDYTQAGIYTLVHFEVTDGLSVDSEDITITVTNSTPSVTESVSIIRQNCTGYSNCYTSLAAWEAAQNRDLVASNEIAVARIEGPWTNPDTTPVNINGWTTGPNNYIKIYTTPEARHSGKWDTGKYRLEALPSQWNAVIYIYEENVRVEGLQIYNTATIEPARFGITTTITGTSDIRISHNIIKGSNNVSTSNIYGIDLGGTGLSSVARIWNNVIYDFNGAGVSNTHGIRVEDADWMAYLYNNTVYNNFYNIRQSLGTTVGKNNIANGGSPDYLGTFDASSVNNISEDTSSPNVAYRSKAVTFVDEVNKDFHLASADTSAKDAGVDLSADANLAFSDDIDGGARSGTWDIGADETVVNSNTAPVLALIGNKTVTEGSLLSFAVSATDADGDLITYSASNLPLGASFDPVTKTFSWTPDYTQAGSYNVGFSVSDGKGGLASETITITVTDVTQVGSVMVTAGNSSGYPGNLNKEILVSVGNVTGLGVISMDLALDYNSTELTFVSASTAGTIASNWPAPAYNSSTPGKLLIAIYGTTPLIGQGDLLKLYFNVAPTASVGTSNLTLSKVKINDGMGISSTVQNGTFAVLANQAPILDPVGDKTVNEGELLNIVLAATDADNYPLPLVYSATGLPQGAVFDAAAKTFSWTPDYTQAGSYLAVHFEVTDGELKDWEDINITVTDANRSPVLASTLDKSIAEGTPLSFTISATDADGDALTYSASGLPLGAAFNASTATFSWTPDYSQAGSYNVSFSVSDGRGGSDSKTTTITVTNANRAPVLAAIGAKTIILGSTLTFTISATDADNDSLTYSASNLPQGASFDATTKTFSWTPGSGKSGSYSVSFTVSDSYADSDNETIIITVNLAYGDVNGDTEVSAYDAALAAQYAVGLITLTQEQIKAANVTTDIEVSAYDAALIAQKAVGLISKFPKEG